MKMTKSGLVVGYTQNDLNHCMSELLADARNIKAMHKWVYKTLNKAAKEVEA